MCGATCQAEGASQCSGTPSLYSPYPGPVAGHPSAEYLFGAGPGRVKSVVLALGSSDGGDVLARLRTYVRNDRASSTPGWVQWHSWEWVCDAQLPDGAGRPVQRANEESRGSQTAHCSLCLMSLARLGEIVLDALLVGLGQLEEYHCFGALT